MPERKDEYGNNNSKKMKTLLILCCVWIGSFSAYAQSVINGKTLVKDLTREQLWQALKNCPKNDRFYVANDPFSHVAKSPQELLDSLFCADPFRKDYERFATVMFKRYPMQVMYSMGNAIRMYVAMDSLRKTSPHMTPQDYWNYFYTRKDIINRTLLSSLVVLYQRMEEDWWGPINVESIRYKRWRYIANCPIECSPRPFEEPERGYLKDLGFNVDTLKFIPKSVKNGKFAGYGIIGE